MRAIVGAPARDKLVLNLDEPMEDWPRSSCRNLPRPWVSFATKGVTAMIVKQNARAALKLADRAVILDTVSVEFDGKAQVVLGNEQLRAQYLAI